MLCGSEASLRSALIPSRLDLIPYYLRNVRVSICERRRAPIHACTLVDLAARSSSQPRRIGVAPKRLEDADFSDRPLPSSNLPQAERTGDLTLLVWLGSARGPFSRFDCLCHALEENGRAFYWRRFTGTINFPTPGLLGSPSSLHDERIIGWVKFFNHALSDGDGWFKFQTRPLIIG
jgi:hypothetical protein